MVGLAAQTPAPAVVAQRLSDLLLQFPTAAIHGVRWRALTRKYEERYAAPLDIAKLGHDTAVTAATMLLWDVLQLVDGKDRANPILGIEDGVAMTAHPGRMGTWPSLYDTLCYIVKGSGVWEAHEGLRGVQVQGLLLSQVKPLLQAHWHTNFEESGLGYLNDEGAFVKMKKMKHLIVAVLKWRNQRVERRRGQKANLTAIDKALQLPLELVPSKTHNDLVLRLLPVQEPAPSTGESVQPEGDEVKESPSKPTKLGAEDDMRSPTSQRESTAASSDLVMEIERLREENAQLRSRNETLQSMSTDDPEPSPPHALSATKTTDVFDDPFEPPPQKAVFTSMKHMPSMSTLPGDDLDFSMSNTACSTPMSHSLTTAMTLDGKVCTIVGIPAGIVERFRAQILSVAGPNPAPPPLWPCREGIYREGMY